MKHDLYTDVEESVRESLFGFRRDRKVRGLRVDDHVWQYVSYGAGDRTILFLHGMGGAYDIWWQQLEAFADRFRVVSVTYPDVATLAGLRRGVLAILDAERVDRFGVVGTSLGGYFTQYLVDHDADRIDHAVLANTFPPNDVIAAENARTAAIAPYLPERLVMGVFRKRVAEGAVPAAGDSSLVRAYLYEQSYGLMSKAQFMARYQCVIEQFDPVELSMPVLIIESDNDPLVSRGLREKLRRTYPNAETHTFHKTGHFTYLNEPVAYTRVLAEFLERQD
ncbi:AB hydrolase superfamily protein YdjP [bacterium BMS3Abin02]|nr:AB hydrolase superfamily protein YdjP [bacterium BMS3Abin02]GBE21581.1 AB hydrolase superfamily protein YdjP [bacterium BMS3Bbin01]HDH26245.1 alpha/beta hydrolase [Actinomycetota bacterium]HDL49493.1 alpha/beta hydrolase [Actinomycetota bacterium]